MTNLAQTETTEPQAKTETVHPLRAAVEIALAAAEEARSAYDNCERPLAIVPGAVNDLMCNVLGQASTDADRALEEAREALVGSDCPREWTLYEGGYEYDTVTADSAKEALEGARDNVDRANYGDSAGTLYIEVEVMCEETGEKDSATVTLHAGAPDCADGEEHDWQSPLSLVGGCKENPGVHGSGGGVIITEVCRHCGCKRVTDTWAQNPSNGEQGLESVEYEEHAFTAEELAEAFDE